MRTAYNASATNAASETTPNAPSTNQRDTTAPGNPNAFCTSSRIPRRTSVCSIIEKSFAPVKKKLTYAITSIKVTLINTIPIAKRKRELIITSRVERIKSFNPGFSTVIGLCLAPDAEGTAVGLVTLLAIIN